ncbi:hypothetical protein AB0B49_32940, partial [Streptomyces albidoflavus]
YRFVYLLPTWCYFLWNLKIPVSRCPRSRGSFKQIPENTLAHQQVYSYRSDAESVHSQLDQALWNRRMISYGLERQKVWTLGFVLAQNATSRAIHRELYLPSQHATA